MSKGPKRWPFPEDNSFTRARKVALAYRNIAEEMAALLDQYQAATRVIVDAVNQADKRLLSYNSPKTLANLAAALKDAQAALDATTDGNLVVDLDNRFMSWGETWHCEQPTEFDDDDYVRTKDAAKLIHCSPKTISDLRNQGKINAVFENTTGATGGYWYKVADVYALAATMRGKAWRTSRHTDTLNANGTGDSN